MTSDGFTGWMKQLFKEEKFSAAVGDDHDSASTFQLGALGKVFQDVITCIQLLLLTGWSNASLFEYNAVPLMETLE